ncbi:hypothetical protein ACTFIW_007490, partial [Dictyostelium discoideum]
FKKSKF